MRALVTGSAGFIGGHLVAELERQGWPVLCVDIKAGVNLARAGALASMPAVDVVFHLAAFTGVRNSVGQPLVCQQYNVDATANVLEWCAERAVPSLVFASSSSIYGDGPVPFHEEQEPRPMSPYAASKVAGEALCYAYHRLYGFNVNVLRLFTVYGPNGRRDMAVSLFLDALKHGKTITINGSGGQRRDFTYVGDVVQAMIAAASWGGHNVVNVGAGCPVSVAELLALLERATSKQADVRLGPRNPADVPVTWADTTRLRGLMDWQPTPLEKGLQWLI